MSNLNLHGRLPEDLPDKETIDDILLELVDTKKFEINWVGLNGQAWHAHNKSFANWVECGQAAFHKCEPIPVTLSEDCISEGWSMPTSTMSFKEHRYDIFRYPIRIAVKFSPGILSLNKGSEIVQLVKDTYLRLKDYIGPDVIQDQINLTDFTIDFLISEVKLI
jgi:hypothetical protein